MSVESAVSPVTRSRTLSMVVGGFVVTFAVLFPVGYFVTLQEDVPMTLLQASMFALCGALIFGVLPIVIVAGARRRRALRTTGIDALLVPGVAGSSVHSD